LTKGRKVISKYITEVKRHGNGAHVTVPKEWIGIEVEVIPVTVAKEESPPPIKTKEELKNELSKFNRHAKASARLARRNIKTTSPSDLTL
jgi:putative transposon-encoded protein